MSNDPFFRGVTNKLKPYWKNHPIQRDIAHGTYHAIRGVGWGVGGTVQAAGNAVKGKGFKSNCFDKAKKDFKRTGDHWIRGENRNDRKNYNKSPKRSVVDPRHYTFKDCRKKK